jgi:hypothetical protein
MSRRDLRTTSCCIFVRTDLLPRIDRNCRLGGFSKAGARVNRDVSGQDERLLISLDCQRLRLLT